MIWGVTTIVGRDNEIKSVWQQIDILGIANEPMCIVIEGPAGLGKSTLLATFEQVNIIS